MSLFYSQLIELANAIADRVAGPHVAFIDPRGHDNTRSMFESACRLHDLFRSQGVAKENIIVSIPATEAGILAAQRLQKVQVNVNLYLVSSLMHAAACAETNAAAISISVGTLLDLYEWNRKTVYQDLNAHPGIQAIQSILAYFKFNGIGTKVIGTTFRNMAELGLLSEFDAVCISREQADRLKWSKVPVASLENANLSVALRARQAKYPTELLTREGGFLACFSPESRKLTNGILHDALMKMQGEMDAIEDIVAQEVERQFRLGTLDLKTLYKFPSKSKRKSEGDEEKSEHETMDTSAKFENWSREMAGLGLDEVF
ncbi:hypothetical protein B0H34DRAFT_662974 [Crassisporium funariophilum]|nr:hypothetical protein B0H34DRAFT_662974 [Crassisporium funariophilum]